MKKVTADITTVGELPVDERRKFIEWAYKMRATTQFNPAVLATPRACMTRAQFDGETGLMIPVMPVLMFDALTPDPSLTNMQRAIGMARIGELIETQVMPITGMYDCYFYTNDDTEAEVCARHGWDEVKGVRLMRKRISVPKEKTNA